MKPRLAVSILAALALSAGPSAAHPAMSQADMEQMLRAWYEDHRETPQSVLPADAVVDTIIVGAYGYPQFDADHNQATYTDTLTIYQGQVVLWKWQWGAHSTTSGTVDDPMAGLLWDHGITSTQPEFSRAFNDVGDFPYFCAIDQSIMVGMVRVEPAAAALPAPPGHIGFLANPFPNPTTDGVSFRIGLGTSGHAHAELFDARGRLVTVLLDRDLPAGSQLVTWDGRSSGGRRATPGVYYVSVQLPGFQGRRSFVLDR
jgi:plastocyanin